MKTRRKKTDVHYIRAFIFTAILILIFVKILGSVLANQNRHIPTDINKYSWEDLKISNNTLFIENKGEKINLTINLNLQKLAYKLFSDFNVPYGSFVAINPKTGEIKSSVYYSKYSKNKYYDIFNKFNLSANYVSASITKLIIATGALEEGITATNKTYHCNGNISLAWAIATSNNCAFEKITEKVGEDNFKKELMEFYFNKKIPFELNLEISKANVTEINKNEPLTLGEIGSGFGNYIKMSPIHAGIIISTIANSGKLMKPYIIKNVTDNKDKIIFEQKPNLLYSPTQKKVADEIMNMMEGTVHITGGTAYKGFYNRFGEPIIGNIRVAGKTGSLNGKNPDGYYTWFLCALPSNNPELAIATLIINEPKWKIKAASFTGLLLSKYLN